MPADNPTFLVFRSAEQARPIAVNVAAIQAAEWVERRTPEGVPLLGQSLLILRTYEVGPNSSATCMRGVHPEDSQAVWDAIGRMSYDARKTDRT